MLKEILKNEIKDLIGHVPSYAEYKSATDYLSDHVEEYHKFEDVKTCLYNWRDDNMQQCAECGEYFLELEEFDHNYPVMGHLFCSRECCDNYEYWHSNEK